MVKVNLDALIKREDFAVTETINSGKKKDTLSIEDLQYNSFFFSNLRKPDFQRETNEWDSKRILELIKSFLSDDLIPAIILWRSSAGYLFVIDGSHRLSALSSWINDDYGDGHISKTMYDGIIPDEQIRSAETTRKLINNNIGKYEDYKLSLTNPEKVQESIVKKSKYLGALAIQVQWVEGDSNKAENSFFKINQQAASIDKTELRLLENRHKAYSIASRAIIRGGTGHKYWSNFSIEIQKDIQSLAIEIHNILFTPTYTAPIKTLDLPIAGKSFSSQSLPLITDTVMLVNNLNFKTNNEINNDESGEDTLRLLKNVKKLVQRINSQHPSSLGLHPAVYFYNNDGRHKTASFLAIIEFIKKLKIKKNFTSFIDVRERFETIIWDYDYLIQQIVRKYRASQLSYEHVSDFFILLIDTLKGNTDKAQIIINLIITNEKFKYLTIFNNQNSNEITRTDFKTNQKSKIYLRDVLKKAPKCRICNGYLHLNSISIDHIKRKQDNGNATIENGQLTHPYCNTSYKN